MVLPKSKIEQILTAEQRENITRETKAAMIKTMKALNLTAKDVKLTPKQKESLATGKGIRYTSEQKMFFDALCKWMKDKYGVPLYVTQTLLKMVFEKYLLQSE